MSFVSNPSIVSHAGGIHRGKIPVTFRGLGAGNNALYTNKKVQERTAALLESGKIPLTRAALHIPM